MSFSQVEKVINIPELALLQYSLQTLPLKHGV